MIARVLKRLGYVKATPPAVERASDIGSQYAELFRKGGGFTGWYDDLGLKVSALSACVRLISGGAAKLPLPVYRLAGDGDDRERDREHPLDAILNRQANRWQSAFEFRRMLTAHVALHGNGYALIQREGARVTGLVPFEDPRRMRVEQSSMGAEPTYMYSGTRYARSEILHLRDLTLDGLTGLSRLEQARQGILLSYCAETYGAAYFMNGAEGGTGIVFENSLTEDQRKQVIESWKVSHQGADRAHTPFILERNAKIHTGSSNKDSQFLELRNFQVEDVARLYGVPAHLIGLTEKQTSWGTGVEQMAINFLGFYQLDWLVMWESSVRRDCFGDFERDMFVEHVVDGMLRADIKTRMEAYALAVQNGIMNPNTARRKENWGPREDGLGDRYWIPSNMREAGQPIESEEPEPATLPGNRPRHRWRTKARAAMRVLDGRVA